MPCVDSVCRRGTGWQSSRTTAWSGSRFTQQLQKQASLPYRSIFEFQLPTLQNLVQFGFWTGLRLSELFALNWGNVDWINDRICVEGALTHDSEEIEDTKTEAGERTVNLLPPALAALKAQKEHTFLKGAEVFQNPHTRARWTGDQALRTRQWNTLCRRAGVRYRPPGQMRHTFASMSLMAGESPQWVAAQMGHTDWTFTARVYYRWIPKDAGNAAQKVLNKWGSRSTR